MKMEPDDAIAKLREMFKEYALTEYEPAFEAFVNGYYDLCNEKRQSKGMKPIDNPAA